MKYNLGSSESVVNYASWYFYTRYPSNYGKYDNRVHQVLAPGSRSGSSDLSERIGVARRNLETQFGGSSLIPGTPLSGIYNLLY